MIVLGIETTSKIGSLALVENGTVLGEVIISEESHHSSNLFPSLERLYSQVGISRNELGALAVSVGPGSFTGIRIGIAAGLGLGSALGLPITGIETILAKLYIYKGNEHVVCVLLDAGRGNHYARLFEKTASGYVPLNDYFCGNTEELLHYKGEDAAVFGEKVSPRAATVAILGEKKLISGEQLPEIKPLYVRQTYIGTKKN